MAIWPYGAYDSGAGLGADRSCDEQLITLCALMSSVLILNTKGTLTESAPRRDPGMMASDGLSHPC